VKWKINRKNPFTFLQYTENDVERNTHSGSNVTTEVSSTLFIASPAIEKFAENEKHMETGVLANQSENLGIGKKKPT
jgi:hypothetical protein